MDRVDARVLGHGHDGARSEPPEGPGGEGRVLAPVRFDVPTDAGPAPVDWVQLVGRFDLPMRATLAEQLGRLFARPGARVILDLSRVRAMSPSAAAVCILAVATAEERRGRLVMLRPSTEVREMFDLLDVSSFLPVVADMPEAVGRLLDVPVAERIPGFGLRRAR